MANVIRTNEPVKRDREWWLDNDGNGDITLTCSGGGPYGHWRVLRICTDGRIVRCFGIKPDKFYPSLALDDGEIVISR